jgi:branched-chain amino acid transport system substrate-binding protein
VSALRTGGAANYDGQSGPIGFDASGDITSANFMVFTYGADNRAKLTGRESAGRTAH